MANYTPPNGDDVNFSFPTGYNAPDGDDVNFLFGLVASFSMLDPSRNIIYNNDGFGETILTWESDIAGDYRIEIGGDAVFEGDLIDSGYVPAEYTMRYMLTDSDITTASGYSGAGDYVVNVYVKSSDNIWSL